MSVRVLMVVDPIRRRDEGSALRRLAVGLAAEGHRPAMVLGSDGEHAEPGELLLGPVPEIDSPIDVPWWLRDRTAEALLAPLAEVRLDDPDVVIAFGRRAIRTAIDLAGVADAQLVLEARDRGDVQAADDRFGVVVAATAHLRELAARRVGGDRAVELPVPVPRARPDLQRAPGLAVVLGPVRNLATWSAMCDGLAGPGGVVPGLAQVAVELSSGLRDGVVWKRLRRSPLMERVTTFDRADSLRDPLTTADVVLVPDPGGPVRSLERQAVARGGLVVAAADPARTDRRDGLDARILAGRDVRRAEAWREAAETAFAEAPSRASIEAGSASLVSRVAPRWAGVLEALVHGDAVPIEQAVED